MAVAVPIIVMALLGAVVWFVLRPLRRGGAAQAAGAIEGRRADLEAARDAKYQEIRDLEMDHRTGKLSDEDWRALDRGLRAEAVDILHELDTISTAAEVRAAEEGEPAAEEAGEFPGEPDRATIGPR